MNGIDLYCFKHLRLTNDLYSVIVGTILLNFTPNPMSVLAIFPVPLTFLIN